MTWKARGGLLGLVGIAVMALMWLLWTQQQALLSARGIGQDFEQNVGRGDGQDSTASEGRTEDERASSPGDEEELGGRVEDERSVSRANDWMDGLDPVSGRVLRSDGRADMGSVVRVECDDGFQAVVPVLFSGRLGRVPKLNGRCRMQAMRKDGDLWTRSEWSDVRYNDAGLPEASLELPARRTGAVGVSIEEHSEGVQVTEVKQGTPADGLGLEEGDVIVEVNGRKVSEMSEEEFQRAVRGPSGTAVELTVIWEGDTGQVEEQYSTTRQVIRSK